MNRVVLKAKIDPDSVLRVQVPVGVEEADQEVRITVEPAAEAEEVRPLLRACDLLHSGLIGLWQDRADIGDTREFACRLREQAQTRRRE